MTFPTKHIPLRPGENDDLKALLESINAHGAYAHARIARLLYPRYQAESSSANKKIMAVEIFCKLMQTIEDYGALSLMWTGPSNVYPLETYLDVKIWRIVKFFREFATSDSVEQLRSIWALPDSSGLVQAGHIRTDEAAQYDLFVNEFLAELLKNLKQIANLFQTSPEVGGHGDIVNMFFNAKHGVKVFFATTSSKHLDIKPDFVSIIIGPGKVTTPEVPSKTTESLMLGGFGLKDEVIGRMVENSESIAEKIALLARMRREWMDDDLYILRGFREYQKRKPK